MAVTVSHSVQRRLQLRRSRDARRGSCTAAALGDWPTENPRGTVPALKEWAVTLQAMSEGRQHVLVRRGGVRERRFELPGLQPFLLFPTGFHNRPNLFQPGTAAPYSGGDLDWEPKDAARIPIKSVAQLEGSFQTRDAAVLQHLSALHTWAGGFAERRLQLSRDATLTVLLLRVWNLQEPLALQQSPDYWGCFSWVDVPYKECVKQLRAGALPAVADDAWQDVRDAFDAVAARHAGVGSGMQG